MSHRPTSSDAFDEVVAEIPSCALDDVGRREQRARYARVTDSVIRVEREPEAVAVYFGRDLDRETLEQALRVERECCPFFRFDFDRPTGILRTTVADIEHVPALDAVAHALEGRHHSAS